MLAFAWICAALLVIAGTALSIESPYSLAWLRKRGKVGIDQIIRYDYRIGDATIAFDDDRLLVAWAITDGPNFNASTFAQQAGEIAAINNGVRKQDESWSLDLIDFSESVRGYPAGHQALDPTTAGMANARERQYDEFGRQFRHRRYIAATYAPPAALVAAMERFALDKSVQDIESSDQMYARALGQFEGQVRELEDALGAVFKLDRLGKRSVMRDGRRVTVDDLVSFLYRCITQDVVELIVEEDEDVKRILTSQDFSGGWFPTIGDKYIGVVTIEDTPDSSIPGCLEQLADLKLEYTRATKIEFISNDAARRIASAAHYRQKSAAKTMGAQVAEKAGLSDGSAVVDPGALEAAEEARQTLGDIRRERVKSVLWSTRVVLTGTDKKALRRGLELIKKTITKAGFAARIETFARAESYIAHLPGDTDHDRSPIMLDTISAMDTAPISITPAGKPANPNPFMPPNSPPLIRMLTYGSAPYDFSPCVVDIWHMFIAGSTGGGKSTFLNRLVAALFEQYGDFAQVFAFDQGGSAERYCLASGGSLYTLDPSDRQSAGFAPLARIDEPAELDWAEEWLREVVFATQKLTLSPEQQRKLRTTLMTVAQYSPERRTLSTLQYLLATTDKDMASALEFFTLTGPLGHLLDAESDTLSGGRYLVFEMARLMAGTNPDERRVVPVLDYIFHRIEERLDLNKLTIVPLDESPEYLRYPVFAARIGKWLDKIRKKNGGVWLATLRLEDFMKLPIANTVLGACETKVYMPNQQAMLSERQFYIDSGCTLEDTMRIAGATKKRHVYVVQPEERVLLNTDFGSVELAWCAGPSNDERARTRRLWEQHGRDMGGPLLRELGLRDAADEWDALNRQMRGGVAVSRDLAGAR